LIEIKDIKSIQIVPYTLMMSSISAIVAFLYAIFIMLIIGIAGIFVPAEYTSLIAILAISVLLVLPTASFLLSIVQSFLTALLYNILVPKIGAIKLGFENLNEIKNVPVVPFALMTSVIGGIIIFLTMLITGPILVVGIQAAITAASTSGTVIPGLNSLSALGILGILILVVGVPIGMFILIFITTAIMAIFYNLIAPKIGGIKLNFRNAIGNLYEINSIPLLPFAIVTTVVGTLFGLLVQIISLIFSVAIGQALLTQVISLVLSVGYDLVFGFIIYIIIAFLYNYLRPKIGGVKLEII
jgi:hypothetical protein